MKAARVVAIVVVVGCVAVAFTHMALHPTRLLAQARFVGPASRNSVDYDPANMPKSTPCPTCAANDSPSKDTDADTSSSIILPDGRRTVTLEATPMKDRYGYPRSALPSDPRHLILTSSDAPSATVVLISRAPAEMRSLVGATGDLLLLTFSLSLPERASSSRPSATPRQVTLTRFGIVGNPSRIQRFTVRAPASGAIKELAMSSHGDRILWVICGERRPYPFVATAAKRLAFLSRFAAIHPKVDVWETDGDGNGAIKIGEELDAQPDKAKSNPPILSGFTYVDGGKIFQFAYGPDEFEIASPDRRHD